MAFKSHVFETAFDSKASKSNDDGGFLIDRIANHPILQQILHRKRRSKPNGSPQKKPQLFPSKSFYSCEKHPESSFQTFKKETKKYFCSRNNSRAKANKRRLRPIGLSKSDDEILNRASESPEEEECLEGYIEGTHAYDLIKDIHSLHVTTDKASENVGSKVVKYSSAHDTPSDNRNSFCTSRPFNSFAKLCSSKVQPQKDFRHPRVKLLQGDLSKSQGLPLKSRNVPLKLHSPPGTAPLPIKFYKNPISTPSSWFTPVHKDDLRGRTCVCDSQIDGQINSSRSSLNSLQVLDGDSSCRDLPAPSVSVKFSSSDSVNTTMSSMESLRSCLSDGNKSTVSNESAISSSMGSDLSLVNKPFLNLNNPHRSILQSAKFTILSPISDKSQEPFYENCYTRNDESPWQKPRLLTPKNIPEDFRNIHHLLPGPTLDKRLGSDSGISTDDKQPQIVEEATPAPNNLTDLPFDMPKLRRKLALAKSSTLSSSISSISSSIPNVNISSRRSLPPGGFSSFNPQISRIKNASDNMSSSSTSSDWEVHSSESSESQGTPKKKEGLALQLGCTAMSIKGEVITVSIPLARQSWYHGGINKGEAENILRSHSEGSYLVRSISISKNEYSLALKSARGFMHLRIHFNCETGYYTIGRWEHQYETVPHIINHYTTFRIPIRGAEHMVLLYPVASETL